MARLVASVVQGDRQTLAFLDMLAWSEIGPELLARIAAAHRSQGWAAAEYANQSTPTTFYTVT